MEMLLETYGKTLLTCIAGSIMIIFTLSLKEVYYREVYPEHNESSIVSIYNPTTFENAANNQPVLLVDDRLTIKRNDPRFDLRPYKDNKATTTKAEYTNILNNYKTMLGAKAYRTNYDKTEIEVFLFGADEVDVTNPGETYQILFVAKNDLGHSVSKKVHILID